MVMHEEPYTIIPYVRICGGTGGAIRLPTRQRTLGTLGNFGLVSRYQRAVAVSSWLLPVKDVPKDR